MTLKPSSTAEICFLIVCFWAIAQFRFMTVFNPQRRQAINLNSSLVVDYLNRKFSKKNLHLPEVPIYMYKGKESKLEITVVSTPSVARVDVRIISLKDYDREAAFECSYDLETLSMGEFQRHIDDLLFQIK